MTTAKKHNRGSQPGRAAGRQAAQGLRAEQAQPSAASPAGDAQALPHEPPNPQLEYSSQPFAAAFFDGRLRAFNAAFCNLLGYSEDELQKKDWLDDLTPPEWHTAQMQHLEELLRTGHPVRFEKEYVRKDGARVPVELLVHLASDEAGRERHYFAFVTDLRERKRAEQRQARVMKRLEGVNRLREELLLPAAPDEKLGKITATAVELLNLDFCRIWMIRAGDRCGQGCIHAAASEQRHACRHRDQCLHLIASSGRYTHTDGQHRRVPFGCYKIGRIASGEKREFLTNSVTTDPQVADREWAKSLGLVSFAGFKLHDANDQPIGVLAAFAKHPILEEDNAFLANLAETASKVILDHQAAEELREKTHQANAANRLKSEFLANMSHEIRTPMTAILGFSDLLLSPNLPREERREFVEAIRRNGRALLELINDILDLSRIEADKLVVEKTHRPLRQIVRDAMSTVQVRAAEKGLRLESVWEGPLPEIIYTDVLRLRQILVNLLGNAVKFTDRGTVRITLRCLCDNAQSLRVQFAVSDTGIGIPAENIRELFQPFVQVDGSATRRFGGTGLGLAISRRLAVALGGDLQVASEAGRGSTFTLTIDAGPSQGVCMLRASPAPAAVGAESSPVAQPAPLQGRVLLAEDAPDIQLVLGHVLRQMKLQVEVAASGRVACQMVEKSQAEGRPYTVILMDIQMPEMDGFEAARWLRAHGWKGPIVALTAHAMLGDREKCLAAGCDDYVAKPVSVTALRQVLGRYLEQAAGRADLLVCPRQASVAPVTGLNAS